MNLKERESKSTCVAERVWSKAEQEYLCNRSVWEKEREKRENRKRKWENNSTYLGQHSKRERDKWSYIFKR